MIRQILAHMIQMVERLPKECSNMGIVNGIKDLVAIPARSHQSDGA